MRAAAEAVIELLLRADREARCFFAMEGATGGVILPGFLQLHVLVDNVDNVDARKQLLNKIWRDHPAIIRRHTGRAGQRRARPCTWDRRTA